MNYFYVLINLIYRLWCDLNLHALRIFTEVANCNSVTKAAQHLLLSQPAVSAQIRNLEIELGVKLITSKGRNIKLTEYGLRLYAQSKRLFACEADIENDLNLLKAGIRGKLRISATNLPSMTLLPNWIVEFLERYDSIQVELRKGNSRNTLDRLLNYECEIAVVAGGWDEFGIRRKMLLEDKLCFIVANSHPLATQETTLRSLMQYPFVFREEGSSTQKRLVSLCVSESVELPKSVIRVDGLYESIQFVKAGYGAMLVPYLAVEDAVKRGELSIVAVRDVDLRLPIWICLRDNEDVNSVTEHFVSFMEEKVKDIHRFV